ncbi:hypothetical protein J5226_13925 [Lysobacter sp. K5869]|uniref:hypothetical protein n=1 Tax=Lysobacter sp. K5869 TaxID=2820808 RepID=UPI001C0637D8|nr:hypothetical protein [Lysobacter sp. K5869]QWP74766.1 hypothetical protein J5226_13925 [Lysobacter sp. K5869]
MTSPSPRRALCLAALIAVAPAAALVRAAPPAHATQIAAPRLPAQGPLAFHPHRDELAWAQGRDAYRLNLADGRRERLRAQADIADLAYADDGALWLAAGAPERWQPGRRLCRGDGADLSRAFGADRDGMRMASYGYADGQGPIRHQYWFDPRCRVRRDSLAPLPPGVDDSAADPGEAPAPGDRRDAALRGAARAAADGTVAVSRDGRWRVVERGGERRLERTRAADADGDSR